LIYLLVIVGLAVLRGELLILAIPLLFYLGAGLIYGPQKPALKAERSLSADRITQGDVVTVKVTVTNEGEALEQLLIEDMLPRGLRVVDGAAKILTALPAGEMVELEYQLEGDRGHYRFQHVRVTASDRLGLFKKQVVLDAANVLFILPQILKLPRVAIRPQKKLLIPGMIPARQAGSGVEFFGVREYQPGDPLRWINSRVTARHSQSLFVNEFEEERAVDIGLILDARQQSNVYFNRSLFEYAVQATTTLADAFISQGNRVGLFIYGGYLDRTIPGYGKVQRERILQALARAEIQNNQLFERMDQLPTRLFPARTQLVFISPLRPEDLEDLTKLRAHGYPILIISPDPITFEAKSLPQDEALKQAARIVRLERNHLLRQLQKAGIRVLEWQVDTPFQEAAYSALGRTPFYQTQPGGP
jgi:uncharacterized repeat protein (TIGR01451 family)